MTAQLANPLAFEVVTAAVRAERARQDEQWGERNLADGTGPRTLPVAYFEPLDFAPDVAAAAREVVDAGLAGGLATYRDVLLEQVFAALEQDAPDALRTELIGVAAIAAQWIETIDRRRRAGAGS
jgi:hypothetical protein